MSFRPYALLGLLITTEMPWMGFRGLRTNFWLQMQELGQILAHTLHTKYGGRVCNPLSVLGLMLLRWPQTGNWNSNLQEKMHNDGVWGATAQIQSKFRGGPARESVQAPLWLL